MNQFPTGQSAPNQRDQARHESAQLKGKRNLVDSPTWDWVRELPALNRGLLLSGVLLISFGLLRVTVPPLVGAVGASVHPYTAMGKQETCLSHLKAVGLAMAQYQGDNEDRFPPMEYASHTASENNAASSRMTWVSLLRPHTGEENFVCPLKSVGDTEHLSSYGYNLVLAATREGGAVKASELAKPDGTLVLADRGDAHDMALLPPLATWRSKAAPAASTGGTNCGGDGCNLDFRHSGEALLLFADGHVEARPRSDGIGQSALWGGPLLFRQAMTRLQAQHPILAQVQTALDRDDEAGALKLLSGDKKAARAGLKDVLALWKENVGSDVSPKDTNPQDTSGEVESTGWRLAQLWKVAGEGEMLGELDREQSRRSQAELKAVTAGMWNRHQSEWGFALEHPAGWQAATQTDGQYHNTTFRPSLSSPISVLVERGERSKPGPEAGIDWSGMESDFKGRYGRDANGASRYKRIQMGESTLGGENASLWEFEIEKKGEPRLRKLYVGRSHRWNSFVFVVTAPSADFEAWRPVFERMQKSF